MNRDPEHPDDRAESVDLEPVRRDQTVEYRGRVDRLGFREGLVVAGGLVVILAGAGIVAIGPRGAVAAASPTVSRTIGASPAVVSTVAVAPTSSPTPRPTAIVGCGTRPLEEPPYVNLISRLGKVVGETSGLGWLSGEPAPVPVAHAAPASIELGENAVLSVTFAACALEWRITLDGQVLQSQSNPRMDPFYAAKAYFLVQLPTTTQVATLQLDLHYPSGWTASAWRIAVSPSPIRSAYLALGDQAWEAAPGCGFTVRLPSGRTDTERCDTALPDLIPTEYLAPGTQTVVRVPQAVFSPPDEGAVVQCGTLQGQPKAFVADPSCTVFWASGVLDDIEVWMPRDAGTWVLEISGCATSASLQICGPWFIEVNTRDSSPA